MDYRLYITEEEYRDYLATLDTFSFMQEPEWAKVKEQKNVLVGFYDDGKMVGACSVLIKHLIAKYYIGYIPRGPLFDYGNLELIKTFKAAMKDLAKKEGMISVKFDPNVISEAQASQNMSNFGNSYEATISNFKSQGFEHKGYSLKTSAYWQPRFNMAIRLFNEDGQIMTEDEFRKQIPKRQKLRFNNDYHAKRGVTFERKYGAHDLTEFTYMMDSTADRKEITLRDRAYFERIAENFGDRAVFYYAMLSPDDYIAYNKSTLENGAKAEAVEAKVKFAEEQKAEKGDSICIFTSLCIMPAKTQRHKVVDYVYSGGDAIFRDVNPARGTVYNGCLDSMEYGCMYFNLGGCDGDPEDPLYQYKESYKPDFITFVGEFDLVTNGLVNFGYTKVFPLIRKFK